MRHLMSITIAMLASSVACGGGRAAAPSPAASPTASSRASSEATHAGTPEPGAAPGVESGPDEFVIRQSDKPKEEHGQNASKMRGTRTEAALKFTVIDKEKGPIPGIIVALTAQDGTKFYTEETNADGYAEVLVPIGKSYELVYLGLGRREMAARVAVTDEPNQNLRLTLRYKRFDPPAAAATAPPEPRFVLEGVTFDSGKTAIRAESHARLDSVVEYMTHKKSSQIEISGHTDNAGNAKANKALSEKRAQACRDYLVSKGIEASRIRAVGYGDERPIASNDTEEGRKQNRRIEATEL